MGAGREDTDSNALKGGTEPGLGGPGSAKTPAAKAANGDAAAVDFDALHAALGANEEASGRRASRSETDAVEVELEEPQIGESQGRTNASYVSGPHVIPSTRAPNEDPSAPAVIVAQDTSPGGPPNMTVPLPTPPGGHPISGPYNVAPATSSGPHVAASPSGSHPNTPPGAFLPARKMTMRMDQRPRRPKSATIVVRPRGPSRVQKVAAFVAVLLLVIACGVAVIVWRKPLWLGFEAVPSAPTGVRVVPPAATATATATQTSAAPSVSAAPPATATATAPATATAKPKPTRH
jgi:hypothetical protein